MTKPLSNCCHAPMRVAGHTTLYYVCLECGKQCAQAHKCTCDESGGGKTVRIVNGLNICPRCGGKCHKRVHGLIKLHASKNLNG